MSYKVYVEHLISAHETAMAELADGLYEFFFGRMSCPFWLAYESGAMDVFKK